MDRSLKAMEEHPDDFRLTVRVRKGDWDLHEFVHRHDLVVDIGRKAESSFLPSFEQWAERNYRA
ncbi:MAG: hypothetical protein AAFV07_18105 [Bacteroidota bacterium]